MIFMISPLKIDVFRNKIIDPFPVTMNN